MSPCARVAILWAACLVVPSLASLFEDQRGSNNWIQQHIGSVKDAHFLQDRPTIILSTHQDVLTHLNLRDGSPLWRQHEPARALVVAHDLDMMYTFQERESEIRAWDMGSGRLLWTHAVPSGSAGIEASYGDAQLVLLIGSTAQALDAASGTLIWTSPDVPQKHYSKVVLRKEGAGILVASFATDSSEIQVAQVNALNGVVSRRSILSADRVLGTAIGISGEAVFALDASNTAICAATLASLDGATSLKCRNLPGDPSATSTLHVGSQGVAVIRQHPASASAVLLTSHGAIKVVKEVTGLLACSAPFDSDAGALVAVARAIDDQHQVSVAVIDVRSGKALHEELLAGYGAVDTQGAVSLVRSIWAAPYHGASGDTSYRYLMAARDGSLMFGQNQRILWTRHEALAEARAVLFTELPAAGSAHAPAARDPLTFADHIALNLLVLKSQLGLISSDEANQLADFKAAASQRLVGTRDVMGTRKLILVATAGGKLFGLHSGDGRVLWSSQLESGGMAVHSIRMFRVPHDKDKVPQAMVAFTDGEAATRLVVIDVFSGAVVREEALRSPVTHIMQLPEPVAADGSDQHVFVLANLQHPFLESVPLTVYPAALPEDRICSLPPLYLWAADRATGGVAGYALDNATCRERLTARLVWSLALPGALLAVQPHEGRTSLSHHVKVLGDRSMKFKYLNPNSALLVSDSSAGAADGLLVSVVDTVTGRVLHQQTHVGARGPVAAAFYDNVALLQFWDRGAFRWHLSVIELFDRTRPMPSLWTIMSGGERGARNVSSYTPVILEVLKQSYFSKVGVRSVTPTVTAHGVTPRHILLATDNDQLYDMDAKLVDVRRPKVAKPTAEHKEERLIPYAAQLPLSPQSFASYDTQVLGIQHIVAAPAELESTTHVLAWGLDTYYVLLRPSKGFDMLGEDFSFALLTIALVSLLGSVVFVHQLVKKQKVKAKWS